AAGVDDHAARDLGLPKKRMCLAAHRDLESLAVCELQQLGDVLRIAGPEHGDRLLVHDASKVVGRRLQDGFIEGQLSAEVLQVIAERLCCGRVGPCRLQCKECRTACEPFAEVAARDSPLHCSPPLGPMWRSLSSAFTSTSNFAALDRGNARGDIMRSLIERTSSHSFQVFFLLIVELLERFCLRFASSDYLANFECPGTPSKFSGFYISYFC